MAEVAAVCPPAEAASVGNVTFSITDEGKGEEVPEWGDGPAPVSALVRGEIAEYMDYESFTADTQDREDHSFSGMFFDVSASDRYPLKYIEVHSLWVRGELGPMTVWKTDEGHGKGRVWEEDQWEKIYEKTHEGSFNEFVEMKLADPIRLERGQRIGLYVHSKSHGDQSVVYDDQRNTFMRDDGKLIIWPGTAHLSNRPFGRRAPWGGGSTRPRRQFVGRVGYGVRWMLWNPDVHFKFPIGFQDAVMAMMLSSRRDDCLLSLCDQEVMFYIMNKCGWDWFGKIMKREGEEDDAEKAQRAEEEAQRQRRAAIVRALREAHFGEGSPFGPGSDSNITDILSDLDPEILEHLHAQHAAFAHHHAASFDGGDGEDDDSDDDDDSSSGDWEEIGGEEDSDGSDEEDEGGEGEDKDDDDKDVDKDVEDEEDEDAAEEDDDEADPRF